MQRELDLQTKADDSVADKVLAYNRANRRVAILCNHKKTVSKTHGAAMEKVNDKVCRPVAAALTRSSARSSTSG